MIFQRSPKSDWRIPWVNTGPQKTHRRLKWYALLKCHFPPCQSENLEDKYYARLFNEQKEELPGTWTAQDIINTFLFHSICLCIYFLRCQDILCSSFLFRGIELQHFFFPFNHCPMDHEVLHHSPSERDCRSPKILKCGMGYHCWNILYTQSFQGC